MTGPADVDTGSSVALGPVLLRVRRNPWTACARLGVVRVGPTSAAGGMISIGRASFSPPPVNSNARLLTRRLLELARFMIPSAIDLEF